MELVVGRQNNRSHSNLLTCWNNCLLEILASQWFNLVCQAPWTMAELTKAVTRLKANNAAGDVGLAAELLHHSPEVMLEALLHLFRTVLLTGQVPETWKQTIFNMLPKIREAKSTSDFHPIAVIIQNICVFGAGSDRSNLGCRTTRRTAWIPSR